MSSSETFFETRQAKYTAQFENLDDMRVFVGNAARDSGLESAEIYAVQLAVDEASSNIIEHAYGGESEELIECTCTIKPGSLKVTLKDCGHHFDPSEVREPDLTSDIEERQPGGLGLYFMRQLMDEVSFTIVPGKGEQKDCNILTMIKHKEGRG
ncbi:MAG TPA: ATP-binding protein [Anaerolineales bacterium]|nr:ATP-binding protein [Anaerolineales bacterium]